MLGGFLIFLRIAKFRYYNVLKDLIRFLFLKFIFIIKKPRHDFKNLQKLISFGFQSVDFHTFYNN
jgi:hypothetical protein